MEQIPKDHGINTPNPRRWKKHNLLTVERHMTLEECPYEHECRELAAQRRWSGYTCKECDYFILEREGEMEE